MGRFIIKGGVPLYGNVRVSGSKNTALAILFASLITRGVSEIVNLPDIGDVRVATEILRYFGAGVERSGAITRIDTSDLTYSEPPRELISRLRASTYLLGAGLVRFGIAEILDFGGCNFSPRPIDMHISALLSHGAALHGSGVYRARVLVPSEISFEKRSVGATVNALILAAGTDGESVIRGAAVEPHILALADYLTSAGAEISREGSTFRVRGGRLGGGRAVIGGDMIEAGSFLVLSAACGGLVRVRGAESGELESFLEPLKESGMQADYNNGIVLAGKPSGRAEITTAPYPGFPTDLQPITAPLLSFLGGRIRDEVWRGRFGYLGELAKFGLRSRTLDCSAEIFPSELHAARAKAPDLRGGMALIIAALISEGESVIEGAEVVERGYESLVPKLRLLGAEIERE